jgi:hypothetical protein
LFVLFVTKSRKPFADAELLSGAVSKEQMEKQPTMRISAADYGEVTQDLALHNNQALGNHRRRRHRSFVVAPDQPTSRPPPLIS